MTINDLIVKSELFKQEDIFSDWRFLIGKDSNVVIITALGNAFVEIPKKLFRKDFGIFFLDSGLGSFEKVAENRSEIETKMQSADFVNKYFMPDLVSELKNHLGELEQDQVYSFKTPPLLGGNYDLSNFDKVHIGVHFSVSGQIYHQVKDLPQGTKIESIVAR